MYIVSLDLADTDGSIGRMRLGKLQIVCREGEVNLGTEDEPELVGTLEGEVLDRGIIIENAGDRAGLIGLAVAAALRKRGVE